MSGYGDDGYLRKRGVTRIDPGELVSWNTAQLIGRLDKLRRCIDSLGATEYTASDVSTIDLILFKDTPAWSSAYADLKAILATREHLPGKAERTQARKDRAKLGKTHDRRRQRSCPRRCPL